MSKQAINQACLTAHGARPHFYKDEDVANLRKILSATQEYAEKIREAGLTISDLMYTYHPPVDIGPVPKEQQVSKADSYGFYRLGLLEAFIRPHLNNVKSCHKYIMHNDRAKAPGGNLNYLANPFWATYGIYDGSGKMAVVAEDNSIEGVNLEDYIKETRNLLATVNVAIGYDPRTAMPTAYFSRVYGVNKDTKISDNPYILRLLDYFRYTLGYAVYVATEWTGTVRGKDLAPHKFNMDNRDFYTPVAEALVHANLGVNKCQVKRYRDIQDQNGYLYGNKLYLQERLSAVAYATTRSNLEGMKNPVFDINRALGYGEDIVESGVRTKMQYKLLYDKPEPCNGCGEYFDATHHLLGADFEVIHLCDKCVPKYATVEKEDPINGGFVTLYVDKARVTLVIDKTGYSRTHLDYEIEDADHTLVTPDLCISMAVPELSNLMRKYGKVVFHKDAYVKGVIYSADGNYRLTKKEVMIPRRSSLQNNYNVVSPDQALWYAFTKYTLTGETVITEEESKNSNKYGFNRDVSYAVKHRCGYISSISSPGDINAYCAEYGSRMGLPELTLISNVTVALKEQEYSATIKSKFVESKNRTLEFTCLLKKDDHEFTVVWQDTVVSNDKLTNAYCSNDLIAMLTAICRAFNVENCKSIHAGCVRNFSGSSDSRFYRNSAVVEDRASNFVVVKNPTAPDDAQVIDAKKGILEAIEERTASIYRDLPADMVVATKTKKRKTITIEAFDPEPFEAIGFHEYAQVAAVAIPQPVVEEREG